MVRNVSILGSTGSIGRNTLDLVRRFPDRFRVVGLAAGENDSLLAEQIHEFKPLCVSLAGAEALERLRLRLGSAPGCDLFWGESGACTVAALPEADIVVSAVVGCAGLLPTHAALRAGKRVALANKESLVAAGPLMTEAARVHHAELLPVDSEHSAIFQCLQGHNRSELRRIYLTASGGPFLDRPREDLEHVRVEEALKHPNWSMGPKITIDSATLMNKGLEAIEARWLFDIPPEQIEPLIHPTSHVHSMVAFRDGSILAQAGCHDMRGAIAYALSYPERLPLPFNEVNPADLPPWEFRRPDPGQFPCLGLAFDALYAGGAYPAILNAANEVAVEAFLGRRIPFTGIAALNAGVLERARRDGLGDGAASLDDILHIDAQARRLASELIRDKG